MSEVCYICSSDDQYNDDHHIDCAEGRLSSETVPLCRRCHRTYHDLGVEWFDEEVLNRAIEIENKRRQIYGQPPMKREDVKRSDYWNKIYGLNKKKKPKKKPSQQLALPMEVGAGRIVPMNTPRLL